MSLHIDPAAGAGAAIRCKIVAVVPLSLKPVVSPGANTGFTASSVAPQISKQALVRKITNKRMSRYYPQQPFARQEILIRICGN
jgi:hypothetical protein